MRAWLWGALLLASAPYPLLAEPSSELDGLQWLQKIATAAQDLNYIGTFVYQYGNHVETSRVIHVVDATGEHEKLETLDGPPREIIRDNDQVLCYLPDAKTLRIEKRKARKPFPALLPEQISALGENYQVKNLGQDRVAGHDSQVLLLEPRDSLRYGHKLWADVNTGLLLKAVTLDQKNQVVEQFTFTQLQIGGTIDKSLLKPKFASKVAQWRLEQFPDGSPKITDTGWVVDNQPPGFKKILEMRRTLGGKPSPITHIVFSDGLAAVSVFIEPMPSTHPPVQRLSSQGAINVYTRQVAGHLVTVLGETPAATVMRIADSISFKGK